MGPYLTTPKKEKEVQNGDKDKVNKSLHDLSRLNSELVACKVGEILWKIHILVRLLLSRMYISSASLMDMEVCISYFKVIGREVAYYVRDRFIDELKKLQSFKSKDYSNALREAFIKMDDLLKLP